MIKIFLKMWKALTTMRDSHGVLGKEWWRSKTLWANAIAVVAVVFKEQLGFEMTTEMTVELLAGINVVLRLITTEAVGFIK